MSLGNARVHESSASHRRHRLHERVTATPGLSVRPRGKDTAIAPVSTPVRMWDRRLVPPTAGIWPKLPNVCHFLLWGQSTLCRCQDFSAASHIFGAAGGQFPARLLMSR
jgi:hypothetical protein